MQTDIIIKIKFQDMNKKNKNWLHLENVGSMNIKRFGKVYKYTDCSRRKTSNGALHVFRKFQKLEFCLILTTYTPNHNITF